ncbi:MAG: bacillithiol biosynthesis cysteine-adding enzyme BshC [Candidatus Kapaibacterium sp.]
MTQSIQLTSLTDHYPPFLSRFASEESTLLNADQLRSLDRFTESHREELVRNIVEDLKRWNAPEESVESAERLQGANSYAVVTGQQAGIATGPLYTLYKAVGTIRLAAMLQEKHSNYQFVPVFWIEADDHDFDEARTISLMERSGDLRTIRYDDGDERRRSVGDREVTEEGLNRLLSQVEEIVGETDFTKESLELLKSSYADGTLADGFARFFYKLLGDTPLVLLSSCNAGLKHLAADIFLREAENPEGQYNAITTRTAAMQADGLPTPIDPKPGALFIQHEGERISLDLQGDEYVIRGTEVRMTKSEVAEIAKTTPERLSPNVLLRPIVQDATLPTAIYLGGPSEVAYLDQLSDLYPLFGMETPATAPRPFVTLVEPKVERALDGTDLTLQRLFAKSFDPAEHFVDEGKASEIDRQLAEGERMIAEAFNGLQALTEEIDKSLEKTLGANQHKAAKELENFGGRLRGALKRKNETEIKRVQAATQLLLPGGSLQERTLNVLYYTNKYGFENVREMLREIDILPGAMQVITI